MPMIRVQLSVAVEKQVELSKSLSSAVASLLGKPESYMMVLLEPGVHILMGGAGGPAALVEVRSVGTISGDQAERLSQRVSEILGQQAGIPQDRVYSNFVGVPGAMWGHGGSTFG